MTRSVALLAALLLAFPASADEKKKDKDKKKDAKAEAAQAQTATTTEDFVRDAEEKLAAGDAAAALDLLRKASSVPTTHGETYVRLGRLLESRYELDAAITAYGHAVEKLQGAPAKAEALGRRAVAEEARGFIAASLASVEAAVAVDAQGAWPGVALARVRAREGKGDEALELAEKARAAGGEAAATTAVGRAQEARRDLKAAEEAYRAALAQAPGDLLASVGLARVLRRTGRAAEAEALLQPIVNAAPGAVAALKEMARAKLAQGRPDDALPDAAVASAISEDDEDAQRLNIEVTVAKALLNVARGNVDVAMQDLMQARDQHPSEPSIRLGLGKTFKTRGNLDEAIVELRKAVELDPELTEADFELGHLLFALKGDAQSALPPLEAAVAHEPSNLTYRAWLGAALSTAGQYDRAVKELLTVTGDAAYTAADAWIYLGTAHLGANRFKEGAEALERAVARAPESPDANAYLAWCYFGMKDAEKFKRAGAKARSLGWKDAQLLDRLKRIENGEPIK
jgi:tetratricopeptide (TPR) repeat protein